MEDTRDEISNLDFPIAKVVRDALHSSRQEDQQEILEGMTEDEFISLRVDTYLTELENAMHAGLDELESKEIALRECLAGMSRSHE